MNTFFFYPGESFWLAVGFLSQFMFFLRFAVQWVATEMRKESYIPESFWYLSLMGAVGLLAYSVYRRDPVFIVGLSFSFLVYLRNLYFINKKKKRELP
jgi:lipid-A-disaccharide synthase-like uncharacterized protein